MSRMFDEMPEEMKRMLGISPTDLTSEEEKFDYDNPPLTCEEIPDSVIPAETFKKLVEARKLIIEAKKTLGERSSADSFAFKLANSSPYAQIQWLYMTDEMQDALKSINTMLHINDSGKDSIKKTIDEEAHKEGMTAKELARKILLVSTMNSILGI
nr:MAG TPA: hypothetical protein [Caudoviricetes sp.]